MVALAEARAAVQVPAAAGEKRAAVEGMKNGAGEETIAEVTR